MQFFNKRTILLLFSFMLIGMVWGTSTAKADYEISDFTMLIDINKDGSADINQFVTYDFDDDYHGVYLTQDLRGTDGVKFQNIWLSNNDRTKHRVLINHKKVDGTAELSTTKSKMKLKVYNAVRDGDQVRINYQFRVNGVVTNYKDTAALNWKVIGAGWEVPLENVQVTINLPGINVKKLQAWSHGTADGYTKVSRKNGQVTMTIDDNPQNSFVESHMVFPTTLTSANKKIINQNKLKSIQKQEAKLVKQENQKRAAVKRRNQIIKVVALVSYVVVMVIMVAWLLKYGYHRYHKPTPIKHSFDVPTVSPAVAQAIFKKGSANSNAISAEILKLAAEGKLKLNPVEYGRKKKQTIEITRLAKGTMLFIDMCIDGIGDGTKVTLEEIKNYGKHKHSDDINVWYEMWQKQIDTKVEPFIDQHNKNYRNGLLGLIILTPILSFVLGMLGLLGDDAILYPMIGVFVTGIVEIGLVIVWRQVSLYNDEGLAQYNQIQGFQQMLKDIAHFNTAEIGDLVLWEQILPYATAFDLADRVAAKLKVDFGEQLNENVVFYPYYYGIGMFSMHETLASSIDHTISASSSGSSGGFTGGSSGGFGGGSGGGAF